MSAETTSMLVTFVPLIGMVVLLYFFMIRPQKKKEKQAADMRNSIEVGDGITTIGGIVGRVASIKEDTFVLETGSDRVKMRFKRWAIQDVEKLSLDTPADSSASTSCFCWRTVFFTRSSTRPLSLRYSPLSSIILN